MPGGSLQVQLLQNNPNLTLQLLQLHRRLFRLRLRLLQWLLKEWKWLLKATPLLNLVLSRLMPQGDPPNQPQISLPLFKHETLPIQVYKIQERAQIGTPKLLPSEVVVCHVATRELGTEAAVVGTIACPTQGGQGEVATPILGNRVLLMCPPVGMEATLAITGVRGMVKLSALGVEFHFQLGSEPALSVMRMFAKVIVMSVVGIVH